MDEAGLGDRGAAAFFWWSDSRLGPLPRPGGSLSGVSVEAGKAFVMGAGNAFAMGSAGLSLSNLSPPPPPASSPPCSSMPENTVAAAAAAVASPIPLGGRPSPPPSRLANMFSAIVDESAEYIIALPVVAGCCCCCCGGGCGCGCGWPPPPRRRLENISSAMVGESAKPSSA
ncbi:unnamed protein product [Ectocarpus sp. 4 AP-2014]